MPVQFDYPVSKREYVTWMVLFALILIIGIALSFRRSDILDYVQAAIGALGLILGLARRRNVSAGS